MLKQRSVKEVVYTTCKICMQIWNSYSRWSIEHEQTPRKPTQIRVDLFQNFRFRFDIAWFVLWSLAQKEVINLLHTYAVVLTLGTHNPSSRRYLLHMSLCLSIVMKLGINNPHCKKLPSGYTILFVDVPTFPNILKFLWFPQPVSEKGSII